MPEGEITNDTDALSGISGNDEMTYQSITLPTELLTEGANQLAVEVHNVNANSSDISFDAFVSAGSIPAAPTGLAGEAIDQTSVQLSWDAATPLSTFDVLRDGELVASHLSETNYTDSELDFDTSYDYQLVVRSVGGKSPSSEPITVTTLPLDSQAYVSSGAEWRYNDSGTDPGQGWTEDAFDDSAWAVGPGQFGFGDGDEATVFDYGPSASNKRLAYYIRKDFDFDRPVSQAYATTIRAIVDDGAAIYLNGTEVWRFNLPEGELTSTTEATTFVAGSNESRWREIEVPAGILRSGQNTLAAEVHNDIPASSDISLDVGT